MNHEGAKTTKGNKEIICVLFAFFMFFVPWWY